MYMKPLSSPESFMGAKIKLDPQLVQNFGVFHLAQSKTQGDFTRYPVKVLCYLLYPIAILGSVDVCLNE